MEFVKLSPLGENGVNVGQVGVPWEDSTLVEAAATVEHGYLENVTALRNLSTDQPMEVDDIISLTYTAPLQLDRNKVEHLLRYFMDIFRSKENSFRGDRKPKVLAEVLHNVLIYVNRSKYLGLDESRWPLSPFFMRALRKLIPRVSRFKGCGFLRKSEARRGVRWYLNQIDKMVKTNWKIDRAIRLECKWAIKNINIANTEGFDV